MREEEKKARMILAGLPGIGPVLLRKVLHRCDGNLAGLLSANEEMLEKAGWGRHVKTVQNWKQYVDWQRLERKSKEHRAEYLLWEDPAYPEPLKRLSDAPLGIYVKRPSPMKWKPGIAVVGTRMPTSYGRSATHRFVEAFTRANYSIISGLALGIDAEAHRSAIAYGGSTLAVVGCGLDICYPRQNLELMAQIENSAGVWSEFSFGRRADRQSFPQRNRIVAAMAEAVLVVESGENGGSLITARFAAEQGKTVYAIPGRIDSESSSGCHELIRDGAILVQNPQQILDDLKQIPLGLRNTWNEFDYTKPERWDHLPENAKTIFDFLKDQGFANIDQICNALNLSIDEINTILMTLEIEGRISQRLTGEFEIA